MSNYTRFVRKKLVRKTVWQKPWPYLGILLLLIVSAVLVYQIPAVNARLYYRVAKARAAVHNFFSPPENIVFSPTEQDGINAAAQLTLTAMAPSSTPVPPTPTPLPTDEPTPTPTLTPTPTITPTPLPQNMLIDGVKLQKQGFNNCGPANLAMILNFWGHSVTQYDTEKALKPYVKDRNVMPYEMRDYVLTHTDLGAIVRYGGDLEILKKFVAAGFPVVIERGYMDAKEGWMGHYGLVYAYDDEKQEVEIPDTYLGKIKMSYEDMLMYWAQFDDIYMVVYPWDRENEVMQILGEQADADYNLRYALEQVEKRIYTVKDRELFFAWYSRGSILVELQDYAGAAASYDKAFKVYEQLEPKDRPWRILWYQTGPYFAYFYTGRYYDVLELAKKTISLSAEPAIPETWVWAARASQMLGDDVNAKYFFRQALHWHPCWWVALDGLATLGETDPSCKK
jgi:tetratricopeptide (TPR) repeat protein